MSDADRSISELRQLVAEQARALVRLRGVAAYVRMTAERNRCQWDMDRDTWERGADACSQVGDHEVKGPHGEECGYYCSEHAERTRLEHCTPPHRYNASERWQVRGLAAAARDACATPEGAAAPPGDLTVDNMLGVPGVTAAEAHAVRVDFATSRGLPDLDPYWGDPVNLMRRLARSVVVLQEELDRVVAERDSLREQLTDEQIAAAEARRLALAHDRLRQVAEGQRDALLAATTPSGT